MTPQQLSEVRIGVVGLGYVGLPLALGFAAKFPVVGFDLNSTRITELKRGTDRTREVTSDELRAARQLVFESDPAALRSCNFLIATVPTPLDDAQQPDLTALRAASRTIGQVISPGAVAVFESTVYPGATEEICVPIIEMESGLKVGRDFAVGYSPERINPGDASHRFQKIRKVVSGSSTEALQLVADVYGAVVEAGVHLAPTIKTAEAAKVIENVQRDLNIALVNELSQLFRRLGIETRHVLDAAQTKWNFHPYRPGLVGGHCIGVDPYYLTHKAQSVGFHPEVILAGRRVNDGMAAWVAHDVVKAMASRRLKVGDAAILVVGFTFKENCPDIRNTKVADLIEELAPFGTVSVWDPVANADETKAEYGISIDSKALERSYDCIVLAVRHKEVIDLGESRLRGLLNPGGIVYDLKEILPIGGSDFRL